MVDALSFEREDGIHSPLIVGQVVAKFAALSPAMKAPNINCITIKTSIQTEKFFCKAVQYQKG